ncbi:ribonuclease D [Cocleimonas sp. KMM 6892]|uniref:ribonuclease D n=1 Tax=unclassified Cocleimonas TaxID=2639732 RepID=UPI002DB73BEB|nr:MULTISPECIES: ribonuclease D [unclassified Cocleimonas]MEB8431513.1 ribonuclease D [Cocleimonas sp. KMM 6892]MEC4713715.1 ribonuclease D [Cocleimonas sp. KMM 6895]MEC4743046.1 ribonuclease D [Cocleimonas sp. KMM 6896]
MFDLIETTEQLENFVNKISNASWVAIDTEFLREKTYYAKLCLVQVEAEGLRACIDPLSIDDISSFSSILHNPNIVKVLHAAHQDLEILLQLTGKVPAPIFDTQVAASVLGIGDQMGYARLVEDMLGVSLAKTQSRTDWSKRPLKPAQLEYAIDDVRYLAQIYPKMIDKLKEQDRLSWLDKDFTRATDPEVYASNARERWKKVRGNQVLKRPQLAILRELAAWREDKAEKSDRPRKWIVSDDILLDLSRQQPSNLTEIGEIRGINADRSSNTHQIWLDLIKKGQNTPEEEWPELPRSKKPSPNQNALIDLLMIVVQIQAKKHNITAAVIATRKQLATLVQSGESRLSDDWRGELVNEQIHKVMSGEMTIGVENSIVSLIE